MGEKKEGKKMEMIFTKEDEKLFKSQFYHWSKLFRKKTQKYAKNLLKSTETLLQTATMSGAIEYGVRLWMYLPKLYQ